VITVAVSTDTETPLVFVTGENTEDGHGGGVDFLVSVEDDVDEEVPDSLERAREVLREVCAFTPW